MPTVFLSSVSSGLKEYRDAVYKAIEGLDGYHCVRMEDFGARSGTPYSVCLAKVGDCDSFVGIVGHEYGSIVPETDKSYCESEYDTAIESGKPALIFLAPEEFAVPANLIEPDHLRKKQAAFRAKVSPQTVDEFADKETLGRQVIQAIHNRRSEGLAEGSIKEGRTVSKLLFPFVTNQAGFDTGIAISNISADPFGTEHQKGTCTIHYYGRLGGGLDPPKAQISAVISAGEQLIFTFSNGGNALISSTPGFQGYLVVECRFKAVGFAMISDLGAKRTTTGYIAQLVP
ncbi:MAG: DUF4062 domain-containing protein [Acidobacteriota bacterium]|nr:DUF4062 domain-containing protein [Acidobacteriota bacterium]